MSTKKGKQQKGKEPYVEEEKSKNIGQSRGRYITALEDNLALLQTENKITSERADVIFNEFVDTINKIEKHSELKPYYDRCMKQLKHEIEKTVTTHKKGNNYTKERKYTTI